MKSIEFLEKNGVDLQSSLGIFGDVQTYNNNIGEFLVGIHTNVSQLIKFLEANDLTTYQVYVQNMMNDATNFGFTKLASIAKEHDEKSKAGDIYYISRHINDLIDETNKTIRLIQEYMNDDETVTKTTEEAPVNTADEYKEKTILVVDDSNIIRNFVKRIFSDRFNIGMAEDGEEAINIIRANMNNDNIEAVLLDLNMPKVDGFAVLEFMQQNGLLKKMPVSIISGDSSKETIDRAFTYDIVDMLKKPFNDQSIKMVIEKTMIYKGMGM